MAHPQQYNFIEKQCHARVEYFINTRVLEIGSRNINGTIRGLFSEPKLYIGLDLSPGRDVDIVCRAHEYPGAPDNQPFDVSVSCEALEHDAYWPRTFLRMWELTRHNGLLMFTCATTGRPEHGTHTWLASDSPDTNNYYRNLTRDDFDALFNLGAMFSWHTWETCSETHDLYFAGLVARENTTRAQRAQPEQLEQL